MILVLAIDNCNGLSFNQRRQRRSGILRKNLLKTVKDSGSKLWMSQYTAQQFTEQEQDQLSIDNGFIHKAQKGDYCFVEIWDNAILDHESDIEKIIVYHWGKRYPADSFFDGNLHCYGWKRESLCKCLDEKDRHISKAVWVKFPQLKILGLEKCVDKNIHGFITPYKVNNNITDFGPDDYRAEEKPFYGSTDSDIPREFGIAKLGGQKYLEAPGCEQKKHKGADKSDSEDKAGKSNYENCHLIGVQLSSVTKY